MFDDLFSSDFRVLSVSSLLLIDSYQTFCAFRPAVMSVLANKEILQCVSVHHVSEDKGRVVKRFISKELSIHIQINLPSLSSVSHSITQAKSPRACVMLTKLYVRAATKSSTSRTAIPRTLPGSLSGVETQKIARMNWPGDPNARMSAVLRG